MKLSNVSFPLNDSLAIVVMWVPRKLKLKKQTNLIAPDIRIREVPKPVDILIYHRFRQQYVRTSQCKNANDLNNGPNATCTGSERVLTIPGPLAAFIVMIMHNSSQVQNSKARRIIPSIKLIQIISKHIDNSVTRIDNSKEHRNGV